ncbi:MAG: copper amine oxidase N-terminal domain-containing protein [Firmicutes bacterium]|nr:copper amine oxidase N-terminal domain-containing protein [Bacillota bacterium]
MVLQVGNPSMTVDGAAKEIDPGQGTAPVIVDDRTFVPIRAIVETMGGTMGWEAVEKKVTIDYQGTTVELWIGNEEAKINGQQKILEVVPFVSATGRTMLPLRFVIENLGAQVAWDGASKRITITYGEGDGAQVANFSGTWMLGNGCPMALTQSGSQVSGTYDQGSWMVSGTVTGNVLEANYYNGTDTVRFHVTMAADGKSFDGLEYYSDTPAELHGDKVE